MSSTPLTRVFEMAYSCTFAEALAVRLTSTSGACCRVEFTVHAFYRVRLSTLRLIECIVRASYLYYS